MSQENWRAPVPKAGEGLEARGDAAPSAAWACIPMISGVVAVGVLLSVFHPTLLPGTMHWGGLVFYTTGLLLVAVLTSGMVARVVGDKLGNRLPGSLEPIVLATRMGAVWVPAWVMGARAPSVLVVLAACFCAWSVSRSIKRYEAGDRGTGKAGPVSVVPQDSGLLRLPMGDSKMLVQVLWPALCAAILAQGAVTAMVLDKHVIGSLAAGACVAVLVGLSSMKVVRAQRKRAVGSMVLAFLFMLVVLLPYLKHPVGGAKFDLLLKDVAAAPRSAARPPGSSDRGFTGIILLPLTKPEKTIVAPVSNEAPNTGYKLAKPMVIPFDGVYWYFKAPDKRPQATAHLVKGSSMKAKISSTDAYPLLMDAHQELGVPINLRCCSRIEIAVQNADRRPGAIYLELWLRDKSLPGMMGRYVGTAVIPSSEAQQAVVKGPPTDETLEFSLPPDLHKGKFDEITVGIRTDPARARDGAQIGIRQFVLYP